MTHFKKVFLSLILFFSVQGIFAQSFPYKAPAGNAGIEAVTGEYHLVWQDNFNGATLDELNNWNIEVNGDGGGNNELQYYRRENISVGIEPLSGANCLIITGRKENYLGKTCTSGRLNTLGKMSFTHGKIEARIKLPHTANGLWPAFWMLGANFPIVGWPNCGEMDIMEMGSSTGINHGTQDRYFSGTLHWGETWVNHPMYSKATTNSYGLEDDFHLYTLIWDSVAVNMYLDLDKFPTNLPYYTMSINQADVAPNPAHYFHKPFSVIFNLAIGGDFTGINTINNVTALANGDVSMYVDYVRVYQQGVPGENFSGPSLTALKQLNTENGMKVYPNPFSKSLTVESPDKVVRVSLYNLTGMKIMSVSNTKIVNTSSLPAGIYLITVEDESGKTGTFKAEK
jgi:beta-glucanase (GH16 family)